MSTPLRPRPAAQHAAAHAASMWSSPPPTPVSSAPRVRSGDRGGAAMSVDMELGGTRGMGAASTPFRSPPPLPMSDATFVTPVRDPHLRQHVHTPPRLPPRRYGWGCHGPRNDNGVPPSGICSGSMRRSAVAAAAAAATAAAAAAAAAADVDADAASVGSGRRSSSDNVSGIQSGGGGGCGGQVANRTPPPRHPPSTTMSTPPPADARARTIACPSSSALFTAAGRGARTGHTRRWMEPGAGLPPLPVTPYLGGGGVDQVVSRDHSSGDGGSNDHECGATTRPYGGDGGGTWVANADMSAYASSHASVHGRAFATPQPTRVSAHGTEEDEMREGGGNACAPFVPVVTRVPSPAPPFLTPPPHPVTSRALRRPADHVRGRPAPTLHDLQQHAFPHSSRPPPHRHAPRHLRRSLAHDFLHASTEAMEADEDEELLNLCVYQARDDDMHSDEPVPALSAVLMMPGGGGSGGGEEEVPHHHPNTAVTMGSTHQGAPVWGMFAAGAPSGGAQTASTLATGSFNPTPGGIPSLMSSMMACGGMAVSGNSSSSSSSSGGGTVKWVGREEGGQTVPLDSARNTCGEQKGGRADGGNMDVCIQSWEETRPSDCDAHTANMRAFESSRMIDVTAARFTAASRYALLTATISWLGCMTTPAATPAAIAHARMLSLCYTFMGLLHDASPLPPVGGGMALTEGDLVYFVTTLEPDLVQVVGHPRERPSPITVLLVRDLLHAIAP